MPRIEYLPKNFRDKSLAIIHAANEILDDYADQGYDFTLRQLFYQFVSRDLLPNTQAWRITWRYYHENKPAYCCWM